MKHALLALLAKFGIKTTWQYAQWEQEFFDFYPPAEPLFTVTTFDEAPMARNE
jgi:hypothetical protein